MEGGYATAQSAFISLGRSLPGLSRHTVMWREEGAQPCCGCVALCWGAVPSGCWRQRGGQLGMGHGLPFPLVNGCRVGDCVTVGEMPFKKDSCRCREQS